MCFVIDKNAKRPQNKYVWKAVEIMQNGLLRSPIYTQLWEQGQTVSIRRSALTRKQSFCMQAIANEGIYVYLTRAAAKHSWPGCVLLRLQVDPKDWLYRNGSQATYRKVTVCWDQPDLEWID